MRTISMALAALALTFTVAGQGTNVAKIGAAEANKHYDESMVVTGKVIQVTFRQNAVFLNLEAPFPKSPLVAVVFGRATNHFGDLSKLKDKNVEVSGKIIKYRWMPEIVLDKTNQLVVIEGKAADPKGSP